MIARSLAPIAAALLLAAGVQPVWAQGGHGFGGFGGGRGGFHGGRPAFGPPRGYAPGGPWRRPGGYPGPYPPPADRWPAGAAPPSYAGRRAPGSLDSDWREQQDEVRRAVREGRHIPLSQAIETVRRRAPGRELDAGLEPGPDGRAVYRLRWAGQNGRRTDYLVDATTGRIIGVVGGP
jgi:Peptidase propeptide and YPEB domain